MALARTAAVVITSHFRVVGLSVLKLLERLAKNYLPRQIPGKQISHRSTSKILDSYTKASSLAVCKWLEVVCILLNS